MDHLADVKKFAKKPVNEAAFAGMSQRAGASVHLVDIEKDSATHYHKAMTEIYVVLEGEGEIELDGRKFPVKPMTAIYIRPGCRHRAIGKLRLLNIPIPAFDPKDEWMDPPGEMSLS